MPLARRATGRPRKQLLTLEQAFADELRTRMRAVNGVVWPNPKYENDIIGFFENVLGLVMWDRMAEVLMAIQEPDSQVAIKAGRRVSKSYLFAGVALWIYCTYEDGQVVLSSNTMPQLKSVLWSELKRMYARAGLCRACKELEVKPAKPCKHSALIDGDLGMTPISGLKSLDPANPRWVLGKTGRRAEAVQGWGGPHFCALIDEAADVGPDYVSAVEGSFAGGGRLVWAGNPRSRNTAYFDFFKAGSPYTQVTISSTDSPNYKENRIVIPGLATRSWVDKKIEQHGADSAWVASNILGEFPSAEHEKRPFDEQTLAKAFDRNNLVQASGLLCIGFDPAMSGAPDGRNDDSVFSVRRGLRQLELSVCPNYDKDALRGELMRLLNKYSTAGEIPRVLVDVLGLAGREALSMLRTLQHDKPNYISVWPVRESDLPRRDRKMFSRHRDELIGNLQQYLSQGGGLISDSRLSEEMQAIGWTVNRYGSQVATDKNALKKVLKRSPDRMDATALSCWIGPGETFADAVAEKPKPPNHDKLQAQARQQAKRDPFNPTSRTDPFRQR